MVLCRYDLSAKRRKYSLNRGFGSFGSLFTDNIKIKYTVYINSRVSIYEIMHGVTRRVRRQFLSRDKMTQMTQSLGIPWAPDLRFLGHLGHAKNNDPNDPKPASQCHAGANLKP